MAWRIMAKNNKNSMEINDEEMSSWWSKICRYLIALNIIPVFRNSIGDIRFSWISCRTFLFLMASYFPSVTIVILILIQSDFVEEYIEKSTLIYLKFEILIIILSFFIMFALAPIQVLCLCKPYVKLQSISMSKSLKFLKKDDLLELLPANIISTGFVAFIYAHYMEVCHLIDNDNSVTCFTNLFLAPLCFLYLGVFFLVISYFIVLIWLRHIEEKFTKNDVPNKIDWAEDCVKLYNKLEKSMGAYFLVYFTQSQVLWILLLFLAMSLAISNNGFSTSSILMHSLGIYL